MARRKLMGSDTSSSSSVNPRTRHGTVVYETRRITVTLTVVEDRIEATIRMPMGRTIHASGFELDRPTKQWNREDATVIDQHWLITFIVETVYQMEKDERLMQSIRLEMTRQLYAILAQIEY